MRAMLVFVLALAALPALAQTRYTVYCANGKIEVDSRTPEQMASARGSGTCAFQSFDYLSDAQGFAERNFRGIGAACSCR
ncbi:hypothetical protein ACQW02_02360 [Humitalea sp. 24SJ18S-53]|uniref:hypothetical protein n=1 Tax=Humitalea sp. 24SJ18S-53 TaxID=3422307 RepID=UPI003D671E8B